MEIIIRIVAIFFPDSERMKIYKNNFAKQHGCSLCHTLLVCGN